MELGVNGLFGFLWGFAGPTPLSPEAHWGLLGYLLGGVTPGPLVRLACRGAVLLVVLAFGRLELGRLRWARRSSRRRSRRGSVQADRNSLNTLHLWGRAGRMTAVGTLLGVLVQSRLPQELYLWILPLALCGLLLWLPAPLMGKDGRYMTPLDGTLLSLGALACAIPGVSLVGMTLAVSGMRGASRRYGLRLAWLLVLAQCAVGMVADGAALVGFVWTATAVFQAALAGLCAGMGAWLGVFWMRCTVGTSGGAGFCYYSWGMALLCLALYLLV